MYFEQKPLDILNSSNFLILNNLNYSNQNNKSTTINKRYAIKIKRNSEHFRETKITTFC